MKGGANTALAIGVGYILGRRRKMRLATMLAAGAATGGLAKLGPIALKRGAKLLSSTDIGGTLGPQMEEIFSTVRGDLLDAAKGAAAAAVTSRVDSLSENLHERADALRNPQAAVADAGETLGGATRLRRRKRAAEDDEADGDTERGNGRPRRPPSRTRRTTRSEQVEEPEDEFEDEEPVDEAEEPTDEEPLDEDEDYAAGDEYDEDNGEEPAPRRRRPARSPVTRTRR
jgi:hypothetical protein